MDRSLNPCSYFQVNIDPHHRCNEPIKIWYFVAGNSMPDDQDGRLSTSPNGQLNYMHIVKYIERNIKSSYPLQFTSRSVMILDTTIQDLPFRAIEYGFETHTIFLK